MELLHQHRMGTAHFVDLQNLLSAVSLNLCSTFTFSFSSSPISLCLWERILHHRTHQPPQTKSWVHEFFNCGSFCSEHRDNWSYLWNDNVLLYGTFVNILWKLALYLPSMLLLVIHFCFVTDSLHALQVRGFMISIHTMYVCVKLQQLNCRVIVNTLKSRRA